MCLAVCAVGFTHGYTYPARFGAVTDISIILLVPWVLPTVMHIKPLWGFSGLLI
ncbi:MAG: hypothetical protein FWD49_07715 [Firmicutes bacterium]|nr:hypothetical protein [Bacillota bacterium]